MSDTKLRPCPFCGCEAKKDDLFNTILCIPCGIEMSIDEWNTRPIEDEQARLIEILWNELQECDGYYHERNKKAYQEWKDKHVA